MHGLALSFWIILKKPHKFLITSHKLLHFLKNFYDFENVYSSWILFRSSLGTIFKPCKKISLSLCSSIKFVYRSTSSMFMRYEMCKSLTLPCYFGQPYSAPSLYSNTRNVAFNSRYSWQRNSALSHHRDSLRVNMIFLTHIFWVNLLNLSSSEVIFPYWNKPSSFFKNCIKFYNLKTTNL